MATTLKVTHRSIPVGPYKLRPVCDIIRGKSYADAMLILAFTQRDAARIIAKKLQSTASAALDKSMNPELLVVQSIFADQQMELKRQRIRSRGRSAIMRKRSSSLTIELVEATKSSKAKRAVKPATQQTKERSSDGSKN